MEVSSSYRGPSLLPRGRGTLDHAQRPSCISQHSQRPHAWLQQQRAGISSSATRCKWHCSKRRCTASATALAAGPIASGGQALQTWLQAAQHSPWRDPVATLLATAGAYAWVKLFDWLAQSQKVEQKLSRKLVHITSGPLFLLLWPLFSEHPQARMWAVAVPMLNAIRLLLIGLGIVQSEGTVKAVSREGDRRELLRGPLYYVLVLMAATVAGWRQHPAGMLTISLMCGGDGLADVVGRRLGTARLPWNTAKSWAGSVAMLLGGAAMAAGMIAYFTALGYLEMSAPDVALAVSIASLLATLVESLPLNHWLDDNVSVPATVALVGMLLLKCE